MRTCGDCTYCCKLLQVEEISKPANVWCPNCDIGRGCRVYGDRPKNCREFECLWLQGLLREDLSPLRTKVVARIGGSKWGETVYLYEDIRGNAKKHFRKHVDGWTYEGIAVIIVHKNDDRIVLTPRVKV